MKLRVFQQCCCSDSVKIQCISIQGLCSCIWLEVAILVRVVSTAVIGSLLRINHRKQAAVTSLYGFLLLKNTCKIVQFT